MSKCGNQEIAPGVIHAGKRVPPGEFWISEPSEGMCTFSYCSRDDVNAWYEGYSDQVHALKSLAKEVEKDAKRKGRYTDYIHNLLDRVDYFEGKKASFKKRLDEYWIIRESGFFAFGPLPNAGHAAAAIFLHRIAKEDVLKIVNAWEDAYCLHLEIEDVAEDLQTRVISVDRPADPNTVPPHLDSPNLSGNKGLGAGGMLAAAVIGGGLLYFGYKALTE